MVIKYTNAISQWRKISWQTNLFLSSYMTFCMKVILRELHHNNKMKRMRNTLKMNDYKLGKEQQLFDQSKRMWLPSLSLPLSHLSLVLMSLSLAQILTPLARVRRWFWQSQGMKMVWGRKDTWEIFIVYNVCIYIQLSSERSVGRR